VFIGLTSVGEEKKLTRLESLETPSSNFVAYFYPKLTHVIVHDFVLKWKDRKFKMSFDFFQGCGPFCH